MTKAMKQLTQDELLQQAFAVAMAALPSEMRSRFVAVYFDGDTIRAQRQLDAGASGWVDVGALLGKAETGGDVDAGVQRAIERLWPEADRGFVRMLRIVANAAARFGGLF